MPTDPGDTQYFFSKLYGNSRKPLKTGYPTNAGLNQKKPHPEGCGPYARNKEESVLFDTVALVESLDTAGRVNNLLLASVERVASGADFNLQVLGSGLGLDHVATRAMDLAKLIIGMNTFLHSRPPTLCTSAG